MLTIVCQCEFAMFCGFGNSRILLNPQMVRNYVRIVYVYYVRVGITRSKALSKM